MDEKTVRHLRIRSSVLAWKSPSKPFKPAMAFDVMRLKLLATATVLYTLVRYPWLVRGDIQG
jgi:hypothetical protein